MHLALIVHGLPQPSSNGGPMTCWALLNEAVARGHQVSVVALRYPNDPFMTVERQAILTDRGIDVRIVDAATAAQGGAHQPCLRTGVIARWRHALRTDLCAVFPTISLRSAVGAVLEGLRPDVLFVYHWDSVAAVHGVHRAPKIAGVGDPWHLPRLRRWQQIIPRPSPRYAYETLGVLRDRLWCPSLMAELLNDCEISGCFQAQVAAWLRRKGASACEYFRSSVSDVCGSEWERRRHRMQRSNDKTRILLGPSNLEATSTRAGLRLFATKILPALERALGPAEFEVRIVGEGEPPRELARLLPRSSVKLCGRIEPADEEFLSSDVQLVPTPFVLGIRLRIITAFSFGCCVVAHTNEAANIPELVDGHNALLAPDGAALAEAIIHVVRDPVLRHRLGANGRKTYEEFFHPRVSSARILGELERLANPSRQEEQAVSESAGSFEGVTAAILAGGAGSRLRAVVADRPKVLAEVRGRPFLSYLLDQLEAAGVRTAVLCTGYLGEQVQDMFGDSYGRIRLLYSQEPQPAGTAGALRLAAPLFESNDVLVMNGDSFCEIDLGALWAWHHARQAEATVLLAQVSDASRYGRVTLGAEGRVLRFHEKGQEAGPGWVNAGVYLIKRRVIEGLPAEAATSLERDTFPALAGRSLYGFQGADRFLDIGTPASYAEAERFFAAGVLT